MMLLLGLLLQPAPTPAALPATAGGYTFAATLVPVPARSHDDKGCDTDGDYDEDYHDNES